jgi:transposase InsO family protein
MSRKGNCYDNAVVERVFRSLKGEGLPEHPPETRAQATTLVIDYFEMFYNRQRLHSTLGYQSPNAFEAQTQVVNQGILRICAKERAGCEE